MEINRIRQLSNHEKEVKEIKFNTIHTQIWFDQWRGKKRKCFYYGQCKVCRTPMYGFDDGENDPRGVLGDHAVSSLDPKDHEKKGDIVYFCFNCLNSYEDRYKLALNRAMKEWDHV